MDTGTRLMEDFLETFTSKRHPLPFCFCFCAYGMNSQKEYYTFEAHSLRQRRRINKLIVNYGRLSCSQGLSYAALFFKCQSFVITAVYYSKHFSQLAFP